MKRLDNMEINEVAKDPAVAWRAGPLLEGKTDL